MLYLFFSFNFPLFCPYITAKTKFNYILFFIAILVIFWNVIIIIPFFNYKIIIITKRRLKFYRTFMCINNSPFPLSSIFILPQYSSKLFDNFLLYKKKKKKNEEKVDLVLRKQISLCFSIAHTKHTNIVYEKCILPELSKIQHGVEDRYQDLSTKFETI